MSNLLSPPITTDLLPILRDRISTPAMATHLGGAGRVVLLGGEGDTRGPESAPWARGLLLWGIPVGGVRFVPGQGTELSVVFTVEVNAVPGIGFDGTRLAQLAQREAFTRLDGWEMPQPSSDEVIMTFRAYMVESWPAGLSENTLTGTHTMSSRYLITVADAPS